MYFTLAYEPSFISGFLSQKELANNTFYYEFSAKRTWSNATLSKPLIVLSPKKV
jgi:hypothetical protein